MLSAAVFVAGEMAGSGVLALPKAIVDSGKRNAVSISQPHVFESVTPFDISLTGYVGLVLLLVFCINAGFSGSRLGDCWAMLEERYPRFRDSTRNPYPCIAECAVGKWGR